MTMPSDTSKTIFIANDHAGYELKTTVVDLLTQQGHDVIDLGCHSTNAVDYPDYAQSLSLSMKDAATNALGILVCGTGTGMAIGANRHPWIRAAVFESSLDILELARSKNHINVLCYGARHVDQSLIPKTLDLFLKTPYAGDRHQKRVDKLSAL